MSNGDDDPKATGPGTDDQAEGGKDAPKSGRRRRRAVRPPTIEGEAKEVTGPQPTDEPVATASDERFPEDKGAETEGPETTGPTSVSGESDAGTASPETGPTVIDAASPDDATADDAAGSGETAPEDTDALMASNEDAENGEKPGESADGDGAGDETSAPEVETTPTPIPTARRASLIGAGLVGALIALGVYLGLYYGGILPRDQSTVMDSLVFQSQELGRRIATLESSAARDAKRDLGKEVNQIQSALEELGSDPKNALIRRVRKLESSVGTLSGSTEDGTGVAALESRLSGLEETLSNAGGTVSGDAQAQFSDLAKRIETLEQRPTATGADGAPVESSAPIAALSDRIAALDKQMQATSAQVAELAKSGSSSAQETLAKLESDLTAMRGQLDKLSGTVSKSTATIDDKLAAFQKSMAERNSEAAQEVARTTAGALAVTSLVKTVDSGAPYAAELDVLRPLIDDQTDLSVLEENASTGVPDAQALAAQFDAVSNDILSAGDASQNGLVDSLLTSARSLVRVRPTGTVEGQGRGAVVARIEAALQAGDLTTAQTEWASLDATAQDASKTWANDLKARIAVNDALEKISTSLTASLSGEAAAAPAGSVRPSAGKASADTNAARSGNGKSDANTPAAPEPATN